MNGMRKKQADTLNAIDEYLDFCKELGMALKSHSQVSLCCVSLPKSIKELLMKQNAMG
jgi:hypothetical protein